MEYKFILIVFIALIVIKHLEQMSKLMLTHTYRERERERERELERARAREKEREIKSFYMSHITFSNKEAILNTVMTQFFLSL